MASYFGSSFAERRKGDRTGAVRIGTATKLKPLRKRVRIPLGSLSVFLGRLDLEVQAVCKTVARGSSVGSTPTRPTIHLSSCRLVGAELTFIRSVTRFDSGACNSRTSELVVVNGVQQLKGKVAGYGLPGLFAKQCNNNVVRVQLTCLPLIARW